MAFWRPFEATDIDIGEAVPENIPNNNNDRALECSSEDEFVLSNRDVPPHSQQILLHMYSVLKKELLHKTEAIRRISVLTGVSQSTVYRIIAVGKPVNHYQNRQKGKRGKLRHIDDATKEVVRQKIYALYQSKQVPTLLLLQNKLQEDEVDYPYKDEKTLSQLVHDLGFRFRKLNKRTVIMESSRIVSLRSEYLSKIKKYRSEKRPIVYLDETWYDTHDVVKKGWTDATPKSCLDAPPSRGKRIIIVHAGSEDGFIENGLMCSAKCIADSSADYHEDMTSSLFEKWFTEQLLPNIQKNSIIVLDNASYHSRQLLKIPCMGTKKDEMLKFMRENHIDVPEKIPKKQVLLDLIKQKNIKKKYVIDELSRQHGHSVLRLPPYYCIFNPIELVWSSLKSRIRKQNRTPNLNKTIIPLIRQVVDEIKTTNLWKNCINHVIKIENSYFTLLPVQPLIISLTNSSSESDLEIDFSDED